MKSLIAKTQYKLTASDLEIVLAMVRGGTLAAASLRLALDTSTVFRSLRRIERGLGQSLFERARTGYLATELAQALAVQAEQVEVAINKARLVAFTDTNHVTGTVRIAATDAVMHGMVVSAMKKLLTTHPMINYELASARALVNITQRDADIAVRATRNPPSHLVGRKVGSIKLALYASRTSTIKRYEDIEAQNGAWIALADVMPEDPLEIWRRTNFAKSEPIFRVDSLVTVLELVAQGVGIALLPTFLANSRSDLLALTEPLSDNANDLWILTRPEMRHLRHISVVFSHLVSELSFE